MVFHLSVVVVRFIDASRVGPHERFFQRPQFSRVEYKTQEDRFKPRRPRIVFLIGIRGRGYDGID